MNWVDLEGEWSNYPDEGMIPLGGFDIGGWGDPGAGADMGNLAGNVECTNCLEFELEVITGGVTYRLVVVVDAVVLPVPLPHRFLLRSFTSSWNFHRPPQDFRF